MDVLNNVQTLLYCIPLPLVSLSSGPLQNLYGDREDFHFLRGKGGVGVEGTLGSDVTLNLYGMGLCHCLMSD